MKRSTKSSADRRAGVFLAIFLGGCATTAAPDEPGSTGGSGGALSCGAEIACDGGCADLESDPNNCGQCGRTCVIPRGDAACVSGECALSACDLGFVDCDGDLANGCELEVDCNEGDSCATSCASPGTVSCEDACAPTCLPPAEVCNVVDDDCNDACDEGGLAGCRVGVHRANGANGHFYSTSEAEAAGQGAIEALNFFYLYAAVAANLRPWFRCYKVQNGKRFYSTDTACEGLGYPEVTVGFINPTPACGSTPLYRSLNVPAGAHFYTVSEAEHQNAVQNLGFADQGISGHVWQAP